MEKNYEVRQVLLTTAEAAHWLNCSRSFLEHDRVTGLYGIAYKKIGRSVRYEIATLEDFLAKQTRLSTSDSGVPTKGLNVKGANNE